MTTTLAALLVASLTAPGPELETKYAAGASYRVTRVTSVSMETTDFMMERDGEVMDRPGGRAGGGSESTKTIVQIDHVLEADDDGPLEVKRVFESISGETSRFDQDASLDSPLSGSTLLLSRSSDGEVTAELAEGESVEDDAVLQGHRLRLALDALLPEGAVEVGQKWDMKDGGAVLGALGLDLDGKLFAPPEFDGSGGGGERGGRGGRRGRFGRAGAEELLRQAEWEATGMLMKEEETFEGRECLVVQLEAKASASIEQPEGGFGGRRDGLTAPASLASGAALGTEVEVELSGRLLYSPELQRPVSLEIEGWIGIESENEFERNGSSMRMQRSQEGTFEQTVTITEE